jgi:hypothetical protein
MPKNDTVKKQIQEDYCFCFEIWAQECPGYHIIAVSRGNKETGVFSLPLTFFFIQ